MRHPYKPYKPRKETDKRVKDFGEDECVSLKQLLDMFKGYDLNKILIDSVEGFYICRPETDEEFNLRLQEYEEKLAEYKEDLKKYKKQIKNPTYQKARENGWMESDIELEE